MSDMTASAAPVADQDGTVPAQNTRSRQRKWRTVKDRTSAFLVTLGGLSVIVALGFMFLYLFSEVFPMFRPAHLQPVASYEAPGSSGRDSAIVVLERYHEVGFRLAEGGMSAFFDPASGDVLEEQVVPPVPDGTTVTSFGAGEPRTRLYALGLSNGQAVIAQDVYEQTYPDGNRVTHPSLVFPYGEDPLVLDSQGAPLSVIAIQRGSSGTTAAAATRDGRLVIVRFKVSENIMTGQVTVDRTDVDLGSTSFDVSAILISTDMRDMLVGDQQGNLHHYNIRDLKAVTREQSARVVEEGDSEVSAMAYLLGTVSVIVGGSDGSVSQWFLVRDENNDRRLTRIRSFEGHDAPVTAIAPEHARKGFATGDAGGVLKLHFATSHRTLLEERVGEKPIRQIAHAPRANGLFVLDDADTVHYYHVENRHPQVSLGALWDSVWYEGRDKPGYVWQSSSATDEFEPKFSLVPLTIGTIKAALYAMLFSIPLAVMAAIYSAYFMTPRMRGLTKPCIEIMEALPTVILGFLAGLWLAPFLENHLPAVFSILIMMPVAVLVLAFAWTNGPPVLRRIAPPGWEAALLIPVVLLVGWLCVTASPFIEVAFFQGSMRQWLTNQGITYDQRNAMVVGMAMGFAVIPTIYSIAEDAIFNVPRHLTQGSAALGATPWQTLTRVVLLTASPGVFSAIMIGFGRAVGETMIVLMATGNSPVTNFNIFEGMRTLSANIAVEMPETEVGGTHFRILFLAALVLFVLTFAVNTVAEVVRQRLRKKYSSL